MEGASAVRKGTGVKFADWWMVIGDWDLVVAGWWLVIGDASAAAADVVMRTSHTMRGLGCGFEVLARDRSLAGSLFDADFD